MSALRLAVFAIAGSEAVLWVLIGLNGLVSWADPATRGLDGAAAIIATGVFAVSGAPALVLAIRGTRLKPALGLALLPPASAVAAILWVAA